MAVLPKAELTHVGIFVWDIDAMLSFYEAELGMVVSDRGFSASGEEVVFLSGDISEHRQLTFVAARAPGQKSTLNQISFEVASLDDVRRYWKRFGEIGTPILQTKNHGNAWSVYVADPEGNRLELYAHSPWYMEQPIGAAIDFGKSVDELMAETEALVRGAPGFMMREQWMAKVSAQLEAARRG